MAETQIPGTQIKDASIKEADLTLSDVTTLNASISAHGLLPKLPNDANKFINGQGSWVTISTLESFTTGLTSLTIDLSGKSYCVVSLSANDSFSLSNITTGKYYTFRIKNDGTSAITITLPSGHIYASQTWSIGVGKAREMSMIYNGSKQIWQVSGELLNA